MSSIDCVTAVLAIPAVEEDGQLRDVRPGEEQLDAHFAALAERFGALTGPGEQGESALQALLHRFLGQPVSNGGVDFTYYEKKGLVYPALVLHTAALTSSTGESLTEVITERFRDDTARSELAELLGRALEVEWVSVFTTFGPARTDPD